MKINPRVCLTKQQDQVPCICLKTGIASSLIVPQLPKGAKGEAFVFEYIHPLSYWSNAQGMIKAGRSYIEKLEASVLAGLVLTTYEHYGLLDRYELGAVEANAILCTASNDSLIELLCLAGLFTEKNTESAPALVLEWKDIKYFPTLDAQLLEYIKTLRAEFISPIQEDASQRRIQVLNASVGQGKTFKNGVTLLSNKASLASYEKDFELQFKAAKKECKELSLKLGELASNYGLEPLSAKLQSFITSILAGRNLVALSKELRNKVCDRLKEHGSVEAFRMATLIASCDNPYDIFAKVEEGLDRASDAFEKPVKPKSLKEILEAKKALLHPVAPEAMPRGGKALDASKLTNPDNTEASISAEDEEAEDLLDFMPDGEAEEGLTEEEDGLTDSYTAMTTDIYASKDF